MPRLTETKGLRCKLPESGQRFEWCSEIKGFGVRLTASARSYVVQTTFEGRELRITLGRVGVLRFEGPPSEPGARDLALAAVNAARRGVDPRLAITKKKQPHGVTLDGIWRAYGEAGFPKLSGTGRKRATTIRADRYRYEFLLRSQLGGEAVADITTPRVRRWLDDIPTQGQRSHALALLKSLLSFAATRGLAEPHAISIKITPSRQQQDFYSPEELGRLDAAAVAIIAEQPSQILPYSVIRLLLKTGARLNEILALEWSNVDLRHSVLHLERDKTSDNRRDILLSDSARQVLASLPRLASSKYVFFAGSLSGHIRDVQKQWRIVIERAGVRRLRKHDLRHSFASTAVGRGVSLYTLGKLLGHRNAATTQRYAHLEHGAAREALAAITEAVEKA